MTARRVTARVTALAAALTAASFAVAIREAARHRPALVAWFEENYPETETP